MTSSFERFVQNQEQERARYQEALATVGTLCSELACALPEGVTCHVHDGGDGTISPFVVIECEGDILGTVSRAEQLRGWSRFIEIMREEEV
jgi:hypothetical protein